MTHDDGREATCEDVSSDVSSLAAAIAARLEIAERAGRYGKDWKAVDDTADPEIGSWWVFGGKGNVTYEPFEEDAKHIAAFDPATVTLMLDVLSAVNELIETEACCIVCGGKLMSVFADDSNPEGLEFRHRDGCALDALAAHWGVGDDDE